MIAMAYPMPTDIMQNETCLELAKVLGGRNEGFIQMSLVPSVEPMEGIESPYGELAQMSGRPILYNIIQVRDADPSCHRNLLAWAGRCRQKGVRLYGQTISTDAGFPFYLHRLEFVG